MPEPSFVQEKHDYSFPSSVTSFSTPSITPSTGNVLIAWIESYNGVTMGISDTLGGLSWARVGTTISNGGGGSPNWLDVFWAKATSAVSGVVTFSAGGSPFLYPACQVKEFHGVNTTTPIHAQAQGIGNSSAPQKSVVCTVPGTLLVAVCAVAGGATLSGTTGWTQPGGGYGGIYGPVEVSAGTFTPTFSMTSSTWAVNAFALNPVFISGNAGIAGATISYTGTASGSVTADGSGNYSIIGLANGTYTITPSLFGYTFSPTDSGPEVVSGANITGVDFVATPVSGSAYQSVPTFFM